MDHELVPKRNWEDVPSEIMEDIVARLSLRDRVRMSAVSKHWGAIALLKHIPTAPQIPWLTIPYCRNTIDTDHLMFFDMFAPHKHIKLNLPMRLQRTVPCGSSKGWLIMVDLIISRSSSSLSSLQTSETSGPTLLQDDQSDIFIFSPISGEIHQLPSLSTIPYYREFLTKADERRKRGVNLSFVQRIELSSPMVNSSECIVAAAFKTLDTTSTMVAICKPGGNKQQQCWCLVYEDKNLGFIDFLFNKSKTLQVIGKAERSDENYINLETLAAAVGCEDDEVDLKIIPCQHLEEEWACSRLQYKLYLVESLVNRDDEILLIKRYYELHETYNFDVFKMDCNTGEWREVENIGDQVIFVSSRGSVSVSAKDFAAVEGGMVIKGNCIYFAEDIEYGVGAADINPMLISSLDSGVYYLEDEGRIEKLLPTGFNLRLLSSVRWFTPIL